MIQNTVIENTVSQNTMSGSGITGGASRELEAAAATRRVLSIWALTGSEPAIPSTWDSLVTAYRHIALGRWWSPLAGRKVVCLRVGPAPILKLGTAAQTQAHQRDDEGYWCEKACHDQMNCRSGFGLLDTGKARLDSLLVLPMTRKECRLSTV